MVWLIILMWKWRCELLKAQMVLLWVCPSARGWILMENPTLQQQLVSNSWYLHWRWTSITMLHVIKIRYIQIYLLICNGPGSAWHMRCCMLHNKSWLLPWGPWNLNTSEDQREEGDMRTEVCPRSHNKSMAKDFPTPPPKSLQHWSVLL